MLWQSDSSANNSQQDAPGLNMDIVLCTSNAAALNFCGTTSYQLLSSAVLYTQMILWRSPIQGRHRSTR